VGVVTELVEYDTEEAAMGWRRDVQAALYLYRHHRRTVLTPSSDADADADEGVRISIPLARIRAQDVHVW
jgi:sterol 3beta-glucosyltransferase